MADYGSNNDRGYFCEWKKQALRPLTIHLLSEFNSG